MALTWDITHCENSDFLISEEEWPRTDVMILMTLSTGIPNITAENAAEVYARLRFLDRLYGAPLFAKDSETGKTVNVSFTPEDVQHRIGLRTNAYAKPETQAQFVRRHLKWFMREGEHEYTTKLRQPA